MLVQSATYSMLIPQETSLSSRSEASILLPLLQLLAPLSFSTLDDLLIARLDFPPGRLGLLVLAILCCRDCGEREAQA